MPSGIYQRIIGVNFFPEKQCLKKGNHCAKKGRSGVYIRTPEMRTGKNPISWKNGFQKGEKKPPMAEETKRKIGDAQTGEKSHFWKGGISFKPYSKDWTRALKKSIRERQNYVCGLCGFPQKDKALDIHHIDYNKENCNPDNLIALHRNCHIKTNGNRDYWISFFQNIIKRWETKL